MKLRLLLILLALASCTENKYITLKGKTMGTYYEIQYSSAHNYQPQIDSILNSFVSAANTYDSTSELSLFNQSGSLRFKSPHLLKMLQIAKRYHRETQGAFEPTLMPLIKAHGFSRSKRQTLQNKQIDSLLSLVSFEYITYDSLEMRTSKQGVQLDLSAMGEGYAIDMVSDFLQGKSIENYKVEIGGEMKCKGRNAKGGVWLIGIENPSGSKTSQLLTTTYLENEAISTSGTSRKFYLDEYGNRRSHIINPKTGFSIENNLLSVTVKDPLAVRADVFATALMVMGLDSAKSFVDKMNIDTFIVYQENGKVLSWNTPNFLNTQDRSITLR
jgi:thiamine biosynthesis lipoprotein